MEYVQNTAMRTVLLFAVLAGCLHAQAPGDPLTLLRIIRRQVSPRDQAAPYRNAKPKVSVTGLRSITGSLQTWLLEAHGTFTSLENTDVALAPSYSSSDAEEDQIAPPVGLVCLFRDVLSYRPNEAIKLMPGARYMQVSIYRSRPGYDADFNQLIQMRKAALDRYNSDRPELGYQVISGAATGTYIFIVPLASLKALDESLMRWWQTDSTPLAPRGQGSKIAAEGDITREHMMFRVEPRLSWTPEDR